MDRSKKSLFVTEDQKKLMLEFIKKNQKLISGKFSNEFTQKQSQNLWQELTTLLNSCPGANKDWKAWRKTWQDIRSRTKTKQAKYKTQQEATGGGSFENNPVTTFESEVLDIIKSVSIEGHTSVSESKVEFDYEVPEPQHIEVITIHNPAPNLKIGNRKRNIEDQDKISVVSSCYEEASVKSLIPASNLSVEKGAESTNLKTTRYTVPRKKLVSASQASENYRQSLEEKNKIKKDYYKKKLLILERIATAKERSATAREQLASNIEHLSSVLEEFI